MKIKLHNYSVNLKEESVLTKNLIVTEEDIVITNFHVDRNLMTLWAGQRFNPLKIHPLNNLTMGIFSHEKVKWV